MFGKQLGIMVLSFCSTRVAVMVSLTLLIGLGLVHRFLAEGISFASNQVMLPKRPLSTLPMRIGEWEGENVDLDENIRRIAAEDDYINRQYSNSQLGRSVQLYVGYTGRPRSWLGHRPDLCFRAHGWEEVSQEEILVAANSGRKIPSIRYEFRLPKLDGRQGRMLVLAMYIVNGKFNSDRRSYTRYNAREPNLFGRQSAYIARVQISITRSHSRSADLRVLTDFASLVAEPIAGIMQYMNKPGSDVVSRSRE